MYKKRRSDLKAHVCLFQFCSKGAACIIWMELTDKILQFSKALPGKLWIAVVRFCTSFKKILCSQITQKQIPLTLKNLLAVSTLEGFLWRTSVVPSWWSNIMLKQVVAAAWPPCAACVCCHLLHWGDVPAAPPSAHQLFPFRKQLPHPEPLHPAFPSNYMKTKQQKKERRPPPPPVPLSPNSILQGTTINRP